MGFLNDYYHISSYNDEDIEKHRDVDEEVLFFRNVSNGNVEAIHENCEQRRFVDENGVGQLSTDPVINLKYHMVVTAALITRLCIEEGLEPERAFRMSDFYIKKLDYAKTEKDVEDIHNHMVLDFTGKMRLQKKNKGISRPVNKALDYIYSHIYERITIEELAENSKVSASYMSRQFTKELGISISDYIREKKIEISQELLRNTDDSILDIALQLSFSSQSHFIQSFKTITGMTPKKYRTANGVSQWTTTGR